MLIRGKESLLKCTVILSYCLSKVSSDIVIESSASESELSTEESTSNNEQIQELRKKRRELADRKKKLDERQKNIQVERDVMCRKFLIKSIFLTCPKTSFNLFHQMR